MGVGWLGEGSTWIIINKIGKGIFKVFSQLKLSNNQFSINCIGNDCSMPQIVLVLLEQVQMPDGCILYFSSRQILPEKTQPFKLNLNSQHECTSMCEITVRRREWLCGD